MKSLTSWIQQEYGLKGKQLSQTVVVINKLLTQKGFLSKDRKISRKYGINTARGPRYKNIDFLWKEAKINVKDIVVEEKKKKYESMSNLLIDFGYCTNRGQATRMTGAYNRKLVKMGILEKRKLVGEGLHYGKNVRYKKETKPVYNRRTFLILLRRLEEYE